VRNVGYTEPLDVKPEIQDRADCESPSDGPYEPKPPPHITANELHALTDTTSEEAARHVCGCCGEPAVVQHFTGSVCPTCFDLPIDEKVRRWRTNRGTIGSPMLLEEAAR
jgi:hypothetical protein